MLHKQDILKCKMKIFLWKRVNTLYSDIFSILLGCRILMSGLGFSKYTFYYEKNHSWEVVIYIQRQFYNWRTKTWHIIILWKKLKARGKPTAPDCNVGILALEGDVGPFSTYWWKLMYVNRILDPQRGNANFHSRLYKLSDARFTLQKGFTAN